MKCSAVTQALQGQLAIYVNIYSGGALSFLNKKEGRQRSGIDTIKYHTWPKTLQAFKSIFP